MKKLKLLIFLLGLLLAVGCDKTVKDTEIIDTPPIQTAREAYVAGFTQKDTRINTWNHAFKRAQQDSLRVTLPYAESGTFSSKTTVAHSYTIQLRAGENLVVALQTQPDTTLVFIDLFRKTEDSLPTYSLMKSVSTHTDTLNYKSDAYGLYKVIIQPEMAKTAPFQLKMYTQPIYSFPVVGAGNADVRSFWAANRGAGTRSHEGIDIYAAKGTPVIAIANGKITSTTDGELGGKQIYLEDKELKTSIYYAHLDTVLTKKDRKVSIGDTIGLVGNSGNAKDLEPHVHFGIFLEKTGPIDPYPYVKQTEIPNLPTYAGATRGVVLSNKASIFQGPSAALQQIESLSKNDTISILGQHRNWFRVLSKESVLGFITTTQLEVLAN